MKYSEVENVLLLSHQLSLTGAPVALFNMAKLFQEDGKFVTVLSPSDGPMLTELVEEGITVIVDNTIGGNTEWLKWGKGFDLIVVCTVVPYPNIIQLEETSIPVIWWIHDGEMSFQSGADALIPKKLSDNIHVYGGGEYVCRVVKKYRPEYDICNLLYYVPDIQDGAPDNKKYIIENDDNKIIFSNIGSIDKRKGQDVFVAAIRKLNQEEIKKCLFVFVGKNNDDRVYGDIKALQEKYKDNIRLISEVSHDEIIEVYKQSNVVVCTSRDDPMPVFVTESMMLEVPVICSSNTGSYGLISDEEDGLVFESENIDELTEKIRFAIANQDKMEKIGKKGRGVFEKNFTKNAFAKSLSEAIERIKTNDRI